MARFKNLLGVVRIGANVIAELESFEYTEDDALYEGTSLNDVWRIFESGRKTLTGTIVTKWDDTDAAGQEAMSIGAAVTLDFLPEGASVGSNRKQIDVIVKSVGVSLAEGENFTKRTFGVTGTGSPTNDTV